MWHRFVLAGLALLALILFLLAQYRLVNAVSRWEDDAILPLDDESGR